MRALLLRTDGLLRGEGVGLGAAAGDWRVLAAIVLLFGPVYGAAMGSYALAVPERLLGVVYSAVKLPLLLGATTLICLPGFYVLSTVLGLRDDMGASLRAILAGQAGMSVALAALAPVTRFYYFSASSYAGAQLFNGAMFALATLAAQLVMRRAYRPLVARDRRHRVMFFTWGAMYVFVGIQMGWSLRPFIGFPGAFPTFFRDEPLTNAYVVVARVIGRVLQR